MTRGIATALALLLAGCGNAPPPVATDPATVDWERLGTDLAHDGLPRSPVDRARAVAIAAVRQLDRLGIGPNVDMAGRARATRTFGDGSIGTCGHLARSLAAALRGAGIAPECVHVLTGMKVRVTLGGEPRPYLGADWLNGDHATVLLRSGDATVVFDPWRHGRDRGAFAGFAASAYCGMPAAQWLTRMRADDYAEFHLDDDPPAADIDQLLGQPAHGPAR